MSVSDKVTYAYIKNIKRWMECPVCHEKMKYKKKEKAWSCEACGYAFTEEEFLDDFVFWFCDECGSYLNNQEGFDKSSAKHICRNCGYENDTTFSNIKGMCIDCGAVLSNPDAVLCDDCKAIRKEKAIKWLKTAGKVAGVAAIALGTAYLASQSGGSEENNDYTPLPDGDDAGDDDMRDYPICKSCGTEMTEFDGWAWYTCPFCGDKVRIIDGITTWADEIFGHGTKEHKSDFELADFCRGGDLSEDD